MKLLVIESGSKGNATLVEDKGRILLIDMGICFSSLKDALNNINKNIYNIDAMLLTHEHSDHTKGIKYLPPLPIYTTKGTYECGNVKVVEHYKEFSVGHFLITPIKTSHDVKNPSGYVIKTEDEKLVYITDTGALTKKALSYLKNADYYIFESNHDVDMELNSKRPDFLKKRILSNKGHLSNEQSANYLCDIVGPKTKEIILAHLSDEANDPKLAIQTHKKIFKNRNVDLKKIKLHCASQHELVKGGK